MGEITVKIKWDDNDNPDLEGCNVLDNINCLLNKYYHNINVEQLTWTTDKKSKDNEKVLIKNGTRKK